MAVDQGNPEYSIELSQFKMEPHVDQGFRRAIFLSQGRPLNAGDLLNSAVLVGHDSPAFSKWVSLFPGSPAKDTPQDLPPSSSVLGSVPTNSYLAESFEGGREFFGKASELWGRDYITLALLAVGDPSLNEIANATSRSIESIRDEWFWFLTSDPTYAEHRPWGIWWNKRGLTPPLRPDTYLLTWDPNRHAENIVDMAQRDEKGQMTMNWSVGNHGVRRGDRVFFMRQG